MQRLIQLMMFMTGVLLAHPGVGAEIGFLEEFSLAKDREHVLEQLIPGTKDYYYYHSLHFQNQKQWKRVEQLLKPWIKRYGYSQQVHEILNRQALLEYPTDPQKSLAYFKQTLGLRFNHQRDLPNQRLQFSSQLDENLIQRETLLRRAFERYKGLQGLDNSALEFIDPRTLNPRRLREFLHRLKRPDFPKLAQLVVKDLQAKHSRGFGSHPLHQKLLLKQLKDCARLMPSLLNNQTFINTYLIRLHPDADTDWKREASEKNDYLIRLWNFISRLSASFNSLKAHVLFHRLQLDQSQGIYDKVRFMTYLQLPRQTNYMNYKYLNLPKHRNHRANLSRNFQTITLLSPIYRDEPLVRDYLQHFFIKEDDFDPYSTVLQEDYLKELFAETKLIHGLGDPEKWYSLLRPNQVRQLKERVDLRLAPSNKKFFNVNDPIELDLSVKNIKKLIIKIFKINTFNYYRDHLKEINLDLDLEGLVANEERVVHYKEVPLRQVRRHFTFPSLKDPGTTIIEFIGNGKSSRALIRKGRIQFLVKTTAAGQKFTLFDDHYQRLAHGGLWLSGHHYRADKNGQLTIPFSNRPGSTPAILTNGKFSTLAHFYHASESYSLAAGIYLDRESILKQKKATILIKPSLFLNQTPITLSVLKNIVLSLETTNHEGVKAVKEVKDLKLFEDRESVYSFQVPPQLAHVAILLKATVKNLSQNKEVNLSSRASFSLNQIDQTDQISTFHLSHIQGKYVIDYFGKTGEVKANHPILIELKHRGFRETIPALLKTDPQGRIHLGQLKDILWVTAVLQNSPPSKKRWAPVHDQTNYAPSIHSQTNQLIRIPYLGKTSSLTREEVALLSKRGNTYHANYFNKLSVKKGFLRIQKLPPGDYELSLKNTNTVINLRITKGQPQENTLMSRQRLLEFRERPPLQLAGVKRGRRTINIQLKNSSMFARVHIFATRFMPDYSVFDALRPPALPDLQIRHIPPLSSLYHSERRIGEEVQYILDRLTTKKYPGNMLNPPELLLNPMKLQKTKAQTQQAARGEALSAPPMLPLRSPPPPRIAHALFRSQDSFANLDFLKHASVVLTNLKPNARGEVVVDRKRLEGHSQLHIVAIDPETTVYRELTLPEVPTNMNDIRLFTNLEPKKHYSEQKQISVIRPGKQLVLKDITTSEFEVYDQLDQVFQLYTTLNPNSKLTDFRFITRWPELTPEEKLENYSKYASHELHFFLYHKDIPFFTKVILPYLKNKKDKTFLDDWLLGNDLSRYRRLWAYSQLNAVEKILLAQRFPGEKKKTLRHLRDQFDLIPLDLERKQFLFNTALSRSSLEIGDESGFIAAKRDAIFEAQKKKKRQFGLYDRTSSSESSIRSEMRPRPSLSMAKTKPKKKVRKMKRASRLAKNEIFADESVSDEEEGEEDRDFDSEDGRFYARADQGRKQSRAFYRKLEKTQEWVENNYYLLPPEQQNADLITINAFWMAYAQHSKDRSRFLTKHLAEASRNFTEMLFALAVLDLPFKAKKQGHQIKKLTFTLTAKSPLLVYYKEIQAAPLVKGGVPILVNQNTFKYKDRYRYVQNERQEKTITDEFLTQTVYGTSVVVTNPTASPQKLEVLLQIPQGAIPVLKGWVTRSFSWHLNPYSTKTMDYYYYFPQEGRFPHYPIHVAKNEKIIAATLPTILKVVTTPSKIDKDSWDYISQQGSNRDVLAFLENHNLNRLELGRIAFRMRDTAFMKKVLDLLDGYHQYHDILWSYSVFHNNSKRMGDYLEHSRLLQTSGEWLQNSLITLDPVERKTYQHREYRPLVNARSHRLGKKRRILNDRLAAQYQKLLKILSYRAPLTPDDLLAITYYLLLQGQIEKALSFFIQVEPQRLETKLQYDYLKATLSFYTNQLTQARSIAIRYQNYPVIRWKNAFKEILHQIEEAQGATAKVGDSEDRNQVQIQLADTEAGFEFEIGNQQIRLTYHHVSQCSIHYYLMDIELLFSRNPFVKQTTGQFAYVHPNFSQSVNLPKNQLQQSFPLPTRFRNQNVMIELTCAGLTKSQVVYSHSLALQMSENYGHLKVMNETTQTPISSVYVKVYARLKNGKVQFYKDGYTDFRGRFDYTSLNTNELEFVERFALLVLSETKGAVIREAHPPKQ